ncbi:efflux RND transporter periplasmic adaptor subunit [Chitinibacteraceae bacterium HSL-7]
MKQRVCAVAVVLAAALAGCQPQAAQVDNNVRPVRVLTVQGQATPGVTELTGVLKAAEEAPLAFRIGGKLIERRADIGTQVRKGDVIARIDPSDAALSAQAASAQAAAAKARLAQAEMDFERARSLFDKSFVSQAEVDTKKTALDAAREATRQAGAQQQLAGNQAQYATLHASVDGVVTAVMAEPGQVVAAGQGVVSVARSGALEVALDVPEQLRAKLSLGDAVKVRVWALPGEAFDGKITEIAPEADSAARTYATRIRLERVEPTLALGMSASVSLARPGQQQAGVLLPLTAVFGETGKEQVWRVDQKAVKALPIKVRSLQGESVLVEGPKAGDVIVTAGAHRLRAGQQVSILAAGAKP